VSGTFGLVLRSMLSLVVVLGLIGGVYWAVQRRRRSVGTPGRGSLRQGRSAKPQLQVLARATTSRATVVTALQFGDRVLLVSSNDQSAASVIASMAMTEWVDPEDRSVPVDVVAVGQNGILDTLRTVTARYG
jgi:hypothetical protein